MTIYNADLTTTSAHPSIAQMSFGLYSNVSSTASVSEVGPRSLVGLARCILVTCCNASSCYWAICLLRTKWCMVQNDCSIPWTAEYTARFIPQTGGGRPKIRYLRVGQSYHCSSPPTKPTLPTSRETRLLGLSICQLG